MHSRALSEADRGGAPPPYLAAPRPSARDTPPRPAPDARRRGPAPPPMHAAEVPLEADRGGASALPRTAGGRPPCAGAPPPHPACRQSLTATRLLLTVSDERSLQADGNDKSEEFLCGESTDDSNGEQTPVLLDPAPPPPPRSGIRPGPIFR